MTTVLILNWGNCDSKDRWYSQGCVATRWKFGCTFEHIQFWIVHQGPLSPYTMLKWWKSGRRIVFFPLLPKKYPVKAHRSEQIFIAVTWLGWQPLIGETGHCLWCRFHPLHPQQFHTPKPTTVSNSFLRAALQIKGKIVPSMHYSRAISSFVKNHRSHGC